MGSTISSGAFSITCPCHGGLVRRWRTNNRPIPSAERLSTETQQRDSAKRLCTETLHGDSAKRLSTETQQRDSAQRLSTETQHRDSAQRLSKETHPVERGVRAILEELQGLAALLSDAIPLADSQLLRLGGQGNEPAVVDLRDCNGLGCQVRLP
eukprot:scaffold10_cov257-Pinguiococcus_pyrenoidosus.AAC.9